MTLDLVKKYKSNIEEVDAIFETSLVLKSIYESEFSKKLNNPSTSYLQKQKLGNKLVALSNIETQSIVDAESGAWARLYPQALIITISVAEQILKDAFETLIAQNLEEISALDDKNIKLGEFRGKNFRLNRQDWVDLVIKIAYGDSNPTEKVNFQNIKSIQGIFKNYFNLEITIDVSLEQNIHFFYQLRHVLIHNGGKIDHKFIHNLNKANYTHNYKVGDKIHINQEKYDQCKVTFLDFFEILDKAMIAA